MKLHDYFAAFLENTVNLSEKRLDTLGDRIEAVEKVFLADAQLGWALAELIPQGSFAHRTIINPIRGHEYDADVLLPFEERAGWEPKDYVNELYRLLGRNGTYAGKVVRRSRCVVIDYADPFHVDVVPYIARAGATYITNRNTNQWELTNPEGFNAWLDAQNRAANGHLVAVIRLVKHLRDHKQTFSAKSVILTALLGGAVTEARAWGDTTYCTDLPTALVDIVNALDDYVQMHTIMPTIADPSCPGETFNHRWDQDEYANFRNCLHRYAGIITDAFNAPDKDTSVTLWQSVFGEDFKKATPLQVLEASSVATPSVRDPEQHIETDLQIPIVPRYKANLVGRVAKRDGFRHYSLPTRSNLVGKGRELIFSVDTSQVPGVFDVYWKVRNSGPEAIAADQLRGQIFKGAASHREWTRYKGSHFVEVYIVQDGVCVALDRQRVVIK